MGLTRLPKGILKEPYAKLLSLRFSGAMHLSRGQENERT